MSTRDFLHQLPGATQAFRRPVGWMERIHLDFWLMICLFILISCGLLVLYSASGESLHDVQRQGMRFLFALLVMAGVAQVEPRHLQYWSPVFYGAGALLLIGVLLFGVGAKGAQRWLSLGFFRFQPSEIMKLAMPMMVAWYLANRPLPPSMKHLFISAVIIAIPVLLIAKQPDLGTSLLVAAAAVFVVLLAGLSWKLIGGFVALGIAALPALWYVMHDYQRQRVLTFLNPESDPLGSGWNIIQSKTAIGSGGLYGKGWLEGTQSQLEFLPERHTDFIIAVLAEEFGMVGVCAILFLYMLIIARGLFIALNAQDSYGRLVAGSITLTFFVYVFVNIGMVSGLLPVVGVPLPLVSFGGTSSVTLLTGFGILMSIHTHRKLVAK
ncbi:cell elongation-specific peptidoglycan biosynthesis regulator RodA [Oceanospirillum multiglobuliferum]|uniref:Peptidoglycan glycosyltransferase MrdB n=1 Tax=Oceanospirillum multiglobuliferum TaxID=64969 RepID=A0A1T4N4C8_9GAMM|nr:rod shape-determining protein RodA [Oceanospirillum multiglobuliferum]OPX55839.1 rod shape-determining protein RodA [Oceanospirillum multiglobuliferum]SJZ74220.1 cell elongation-specific peptidoglycan biosynthesis regulator RodA [Oceanospirillum multiglobuliferum]